MWQKQKEDRHEIKSLIVVKNVKIHDYIHHGDTEKLKNNNNKKKSWIANLFVYSRASCRYPRYHCSGTDITIQWITAWTIEKRITPVRRIRVRGQPCASGQWGEVGPRHKISWSPRWWRRAHLRRPDDPLPPRSQFRRRRRTLSPRQWWISSTAPCSSAARLAWVTNPKTCTETRVLGQPKYEREPSAVSQ